jgi:hypothetical protein
VEKEKGQDQNSANGAGLYHEGGNSDWGKRTMIRRFLIAAYKFSCGIGRDVSKQNFSSNCVGERE